MPTDRDYAESMELVESVMEWIGMRWTTSMIKRELREYFGSDLSFMTVNFLIKTANKEIRKRYNIDPQHYKGIQITFYESIIRKEHEKTKNKLSAAERLDKLFGLEQISADDPEIQARKIREALIEMDESVGEPDNGGDQESIEENEQGNKDDGEGEVELNRNNGRDKKQDTRSSSEETKKQEERATEVPENPTIKEPETSEESKLETENDSVSPKIFEELNNLKDEDYKRFRKGKR